MTCGHREHKTGHLSDNSHVKEAKHLVYLVLPLGMNCICERNDFPFSAVWAESHAYLPGCMYPIFDLTSL